MRLIRRTVSPLLAACLPMFILVGCAAGGASGGRAAMDGGVKCPAGFTATCEVRKTGRIHHGTFGKDYDSCACVSNSQQPRMTPVIPRL